MRCAVTLSIWRRAGVQWASPLAVASTVVMSPSLRREMLARPAMPDSAWQRRGPPNQPPPAASSTAASIRPKRPARRGRSNVNQCQRGPRIPTRSRSPVANPRSPHTRAARRRRHLATNGLRGIEAGWHGRHRKHWSLRRPNGVLRGGVVATAILSVFAGAEDFDQAI